MALHLQVNSKHVIKVDMKIRINEINTLVNLNRRISVDES